MSSNRSKSRSPSPNDNSVGKAQMILKIHLQGAIPKRNLQSDTEESDIEEVSGSPHKDKDHKHYKESQSRTSKPNEEVIKHKDRHNTDGASENVKRGNKDPNSASQKDRPPTEHRHRDTTTDELGTSRSDKDRDTKPAPQKVRPHTDRKHRVDKREDAAVESSDYEGDSKDSPHKPRHGDRKHHAKEKQQIEQRNNEDTDSDVQKKSSETKTSKEKKKKLDQQKQPEKYEGLPLEENSEGRSRSNKPSSKERENAEQKQKRAGGTASSGPGPESGKVAKCRNDISLTFPDRDGNKSTMRIVVRSFATPSKSQNCVDVKIEGGKFNSGNINNKEIENLIRELTKYVIQIQRALEDDKLSQGNKSINEQHNSLEVIELFKRTDKHLGKSAKEIKVAPTKSKVELGLSMKFIPVGSEKAEHEKISSQETNKKREQTKTHSASESSDNKHPELQTNTNEEATSKHRKSKKEVKPEECKNNKREDGPDGKEEPRERKDVAAQTQFDSQENYQKEESNMGETQEKSGERKSGKKRTIDNIDTVTKNPKKPKADDSDTTHHDCKNRDQTKKKSKSKEQSSQGVTSTAAGKNDSKKAVDGKVSLACMKSSVSKILLKLTSSRTLVAEGLTSAIRKKHKEEKPEKGKTKKKSQSKIEERSSMTKTVQIPVVFEEKESAFQSKSSVKINMEHSTDEGNLSLNLVGIRNEETQDFGGRIEFCQAYNDPKKQTEDVETMKELLTKCVKKVENVLSNLYKEQNETALQDKPSPNTKNTTVQAVETPDSYPQAVETLNSHPKLDGIIRKQSSTTNYGASPFELNNTKPPGSVTSIKASDRRISFRDHNLIEVVPVDESLLKPESDKTDDECSGGPEGECNECDPDVEDLQMANKDVDDIVQAKLDAGEFEREARKSFERERFSLTLKDADAIERYKKNSRSKLGSATSWQEDSTGADNQAQNSSTINLALALSTEDNNTTTFLGITTWPSEGNDSNTEVQTISSQPISDGLENKIKIPNDPIDDSNSPMARKASTSSHPDLENKEKSTSTGSIHDSSNLVAMMASMYSRPISSDFENVGRKSILKGATNDNITPMSTAASENENVENVRKKSILKGSNTRIANAASTTSRPISVDFENEETIIPRGSIASDTPTDIAESSSSSPTHCDLSPEEMNSISFLYDNTPMAMKASTSNHLIPDSGRNSPTKSFNFENTAQIVMAVRVPNRPTTSTVPEGEESRPKKKGCCEQPVTTAVPEAEEPHPKKKGCCELF